MRRRTIVLLLFLAVTMISGSPPSWATPSRPLHRLPDLFRFHVACSQRLGDTGEFKGSCFVEALVPLRATLYLTPSDGVSLRGGRQAKRLWLKPGTPQVFPLSGHVSTTAPRPAGINCKLRFRLPLKTIRYKVERYEDKLLRRETLRRLDRIEAAGGRTIEANRALLFE